MYAVTSRHREGSAADNRHSFGSQASIARPTPARQPLGIVDPNINYHGMNAGMSVGMKVGRQSGGASTRVVPGAPRAPGNSLLDMR